MRGCVRDTMLSVSLFAAAAAATTSTREEISFNFGWRFKHGERYPTFKPSAFAPIANASSPEAASGFDDSGWQLIDVPHDMLIGGTYSSQGDGLEMAHLPRGDGWYRKHFKLPTDWQHERAIWLAFEGVWQRTTMFLNGAPLPVDRTSSFEPCTPDNPGTAVFCANGTEEFYTGHWEG
jgi:beta-galactosidase/beta-glucuronidase